MREQLSIQIRMPKLLIVALLILPVLMLSVIVFMLVKLNSPTRTPIIHRLSVFKSSAFDVPGQKYQLRVSKQPNGSGYISYLRWNDTHPEGSGNTQLGIYFHDDKNANKPKPLTGFDGSTLGAKLFWSKDSSVFAISVMESTYFVYDFRKHEVIKDITFDPVNAKTKQVQTLLEKRGGRVDALFSEPRWISFEEFQKFPRGCS